MNLRQQRIEVVRSNTRGLSSMSRKSCDSIAETLSRYFSSVDIIDVDTVKDLYELAKRKPDLVFLGVKFMPVDGSLGLNDPDKIWVGDFLDRHQIAYTGSGYEAHYLECNKPQAKERVIDSNLNTSPYYVVAQGDTLATSTVPLRFPMFIKPSNRGGGIGVDDKSVVSTNEELASKAFSITRELGSDALVEEYLPGREFSVAILKDAKGDGYAVMPIELSAPVVANGDSVLNSKIKTLNIEVISAVEASKLRDDIVELALAVFHAIGARDYGRIDIRLDSNGVPNFLEANLIPSLICGYGSFPKACVLNIGLEYDDMILSIVDLCLARTAQA